MKSKEVCPICGRFLRTKCFRINRKDGTWMCRRCISQIGENKFYVPEMKGAKKRYGRKLSTINFKEDEKTYLYKKYYKQGLDSKDIKEKIKSERSFINKIHKLFNTNDFKKQKEGKGMQKKFIEGLK